MTMTIIKIAAGRSDQTELRASDVPGMPSISRGSLG